MSQELVGAIKQSKDLQRNIKSIESIEQFYNWLDDFSKLHMSIRKWTMRHRLVITTFIIQTSIHLILLFLGTNFHIPELTIYTFGCKFFNINKLFLLSFRDNTSLFLRYSCSNDSCTYIFSCYNRKQINGMCI